MSDRPLIECANFAEVHRLYQRLWSLAVGKRDYNKRDWIDLETAIIALAKDGPGGPVTP